MNVVPVATGILQDAEGRLLISLRPEGKPWPGFWEFPGGKVDPGETPAEALQRELWEEIGIRVLDAEPFRTLDYTYPERTVRLHFYRVRRWEGDAYGKEGQQIRWLYPWEIPALECLPANLRMTAAVLEESLPRPPLCLIADPSRLEPAVFANAWRQALRAGLRWVILRCKNPLDAGQVSQLHKLCAETLAQGAQLWLNHPDPLPDWPRTGRHLTQAQLDAGLRPDEAFGVSCHDGEGVHQAARAGARYALLSPLFPTASHPDTPALGADAFAELVESAAIPLIALGGLSAERIPAAMATGASGVAVLSGILEASDPFVVTTDFLHYWRP
ncbi:Nudix family hydrolase [Acidithiobacillus montserratensis]|uniref:Nudix family hydrolase n=1 Tax=Acidithiobacillus montserratensis TaxID=2729135 RepID=A0ACD5HEF6_9PROT|nr:Nudix family hydrolase [Acidithiobacillus montserratensis]MBN2679377.1 Nudix family hydrolase [Acidithiobacillaceae bacterium]MBU2747575.1 Nudix family hydrolase [Acidithiobacillus montserratensis]